MSIQIANFFWNFLYFYRIFLKNCPFFGNFGLLVNQLPFFAKFYLFGGIGAFFAFF